MQQHRPNVTLQRAGSQQEASIPEPAAMATLARIWGALESETNDSTGLQFDAALAAQLAIPVATLRETLANNFSRARDELKNVFAGNPSQIEQRLIDAVNRIPPTQKILVSLLFNEQLSPDEVAQVMAYTAIEARSECTKALISLRIAMTPAMAPQKPGEIP